jgi:hypothetical protein
MITLNLLIDPGASGLKVLASNGDLAPEYFLMGAELAKTSEQPSFSTVGDIDLDPTLCSWVTHEGIVYVLGEIARSMFNGRSPMAQVKANYLIPRVLAVVACCAHKFKDNRMALDIAFLLPPGECDDIKTNSEHRAELEEQLKAALKQFDSVAGVIHAKLTKFRFAPEGSGLSRHYLQSRPQAITKKTIVIVFGHRNIGTSYLSGGIYSQMQSRNTGFSNTIDRIASTLKTTPLKAMKSALTLVSEPKIQTILTDYWHSAEADLDEAIDPDTEEAIVGGGALVWVKPMLQKYLSDRLPLLEGRDKPGIFFNSNFTWPADCKLPVELRDRFVDAHLSYQYTFGKK